MPNWRGTDETRGYISRGAPAHAFTLIELLTVIAIVGILASLSFSGLVQAKQRARSVLCQSNMRQIGISLEMYTGDHSYFPPFADLRVSPYIRMWPPLLLAYAGDTDIFHCPEAPASNRWTVADSPYGFSFPFNVDVAQPFSYGYNRDGVRWGYELGLSADGQHLASPSEVKAPSQFLTLADSSGIASIHFEFVSRYRKVLGPPEDRHPGGATVLFADGSTQTKKQKFLLKRENTSARLWNIDHKPHRELW